MEIADTGKGIAGDLRQTVFDPFYTTNPEGMGLGLSISKLIIEAHNGKIEADNTTCGGAVFTVTLPVAP